MKLLSFAVPCYNSAAYMRHCISTLLSGGDEVEILIVDDGSVKDNTAEIADEYEKKYPGICRAIHQENKGHGGAVCTGLANATGVFFKVVDSDDWLDTRVLKKVLGILRGFVQADEQLDMMVCNYVYDKDGAKHKKVMSYRRVLPEGRIFGWGEIGRFLPGHYILMHSVIYRTKMLRDCGLSLPEHTFYVDNIFVYQPLPHVKTIYYLNENLYRYYIGREDQSVNEKVMIGRIDQQLKVTDIMLDCYDPYRVEPKSLRRYMILYLEIMVTICSMLAIKSGTDENFEKKKALWTRIRKKNFWLFMRLRFGFLGQGVNLPGKAGRKVSVTAYRIAQKFYGFN